DTDGKRMYRSGDIGRMLPNGEIEFLERKDTQVKLNGLRIELAEIEFQLDRIPTIAKSVVVLKELNGSLHIAAYIQKEAEISNDEIYQILKEHLPAYMMPSVFVSMDEFPRTRTGKIDRKSLPALTSIDVKKTEYVAPTSEVEKQLVAFWSETLNIAASSIGVQDNFLELGGNSLQAVILVNKVNKFFETFLTIEYLYDTLTISALAELIEFSIQQKHIDLINEDVDQDEFIL
ncbi:non-ribosomal peptide synthetase, partial [Kordia sp.]|uniref:non-ribosomal peptide synthetase n=1 Tax=Kordia sp. TaxID=1965332 RepID=UPI0025C0016F